MKTRSLIKAAISQDMNLFKYSTKKNSSTLKKIIFPVFLFLIVSVSIGSYAFLLAHELKNINLTYIMLSMFIFMVTILSFMQGIYKSQGILFEAKDNDLLFSLPIKKSKILFVRIFKLLLFQYIYNLMFILPAFIIYIYFEHPGFNFYIISIIMTFLIPLIPTTISSAIGYIIKLFSSKSNFKKMIQTILSILVFIIIFFISQKLDSFISNIASKATSINDMLVKIYYPIGTYINLINKFNIIDFIKLLLVNIIPFILFIIIGSKYYFKIISNNVSASTKKKVKNVKEIKIKQNKKVVSLTIKELKRYFSSPVYIFNTFFAIALVFIMTIILCIKGKEAFLSVLNGYNISSDISISILYYGLIMFATTLTSITSSSISLESKTFNLTKSLPVSIKTILHSKLIYPFIIELPVILLSELIYFIVFKPKLFYIISILLLNIIMIFFSSVFGLIINLKYPKMSSTNDTEVVKQSMSSFLSVLMGTIIFVLSILCIALFNNIGIKLLITLHLLILLIIDIILYLILIKYGVKDYKKINV